MKTSQISEVLWLFMDNRQDPECKEKVLCMFMVEQGTYLSLRDPVDDFPIFQNSQGKQLKFKVIPMGVCLTSSRQLEHNVINRRTEQQRASHRSGGWMYKGIRRSCFLAHGWFPSIYPLTWQKEGEALGPVFIRSTIPWMGSLPKTPLLTPYSEERLWWQNLEGTKAAVLLRQPWSHLAQKRSKR